MIVSSLVLTEIPKHPEYSFYNNKGALRNVNQLNYLDFALSFLLRVALTHLIN